MFTPVNKKYRMAQKHKNLAAFTAIIGVLTLILSVSALAEKAHGDHLPERNGRGTCEAVIPLGVPEGILILVSAVSGFVRRQNRYQNSTGNAAGIAQSGCMATADPFPMEWPMRLSYFPLSAHS